MIAFLTHNKNARFDTSCLIGRQQLSPASSRPCKANAKGKLSRYHIVKLATSIGNSDMETSACCYSDRPDAARVGKTSRARMSKPCPSPRVPFTQQPGARLIRRAGVQRCQTSRREAILSTLQKPARRFTMRPATLTVCSAGSCCGCSLCKASFAGRLGWYDKYFAYSMAYGMQDYERTIAARKKALFAELFQLPVESLLEIGIGAGANNKYYAEQQVHCMSLSVVLAQLCLLEC